MIAGGSKCGLQSNLLTGIQIYYDHVFKFYKFLRDNRIFSNDIDCCVIIICHTEIDNLLI